MILCKSPTDSLYDATLIAAKEYTINFSEKKKQSCLSLQCNGLSSYIFVNGVWIYKFKAKISEINTPPLSLGNISKDLSVDSLNNTGLYRYVYDFSVDYDSIDIDDNLDIHKCLAKKHV